MAKSPETRRYEPSSEETKRAEEMMTPEQGAQSQARGEGFELGRQESMGENRGEKKEFSPLERIKSFEQEIAAKQGESTKIAEYIKETKSELNKARAELGLPPFEEETPSTSFDQKRVEKLEKELAALKAEKLSTTPESDRKSEIEEAKLTDSQSSKLHYIRKDKKREAGEKKENDRKYETEGRKLDPKSESFAKVGDQVYSEGKFYDVYEADEGMLTLMGENGGLAGAVTRASVEKVTPENRKNLEKAARQRQTALESNLQVPKRVVKKILSKLRKSDSGEESRERKAA